MKSLYSSLESMFGSRVSRDGANPADLVLIDGEIATCDPGRSRASALAVRDGRFVFVGDERGVAEFIGLDTEVIDARGRVVTPGFIDNHCHVVWIGGLMSVMPKTLFDAGSLDELREMVLDQARSNPDLPYVSGVGWRFEHVPGGVPGRELMDSVVPDRPVLLMSLCGQCGWLNTPALEFLEERNPAALRRLVPRRDASGAMLGPLDHFHSFSPLDFWTPGEIAPVFDTAVPRAISGVLDEAVSVGVTGMDDVQFYRPFVDYVLKYREMGVFDGVRLRGSFYIDPYDLEDEAALREGLEWWSGMRSSGEERLALGRSVKFYIDGTMGNRTAWLKEPYCDDRSTHGRPDWEQEGFDRVIELVDSMGLQACTHACGDAGITRVIDSCERARRANGERDSRHRIEHCELPVPSDRERMAALGMHAAMQPTHFFGDEVVENALGPERVKRYCPWNSLEKAGVSLSFGSDWCNSPLNPVYGLLIAGTRMNFRGNTSWGPDEKIDVESGVRHWTIDSARALQMEDEIGSIEVGKRADFVVFNTSPLKVTSWWFMLTHKLDIGELDGFVDMTYVGGALSYDRARGAVRAG